MARWSVPILQLEGRVHLLDSVGFWQLDSLVEVHALAADQHVGDVLTHAGLGLGMCHEHLASPPPLGLYLWSRLP